MGKIEGIDKNQITVLLGHRQVPEGYIYDSLEQNNPSQKHTARRHILRWRRIRLEAATAWQVRNTTP